MNSKNDCADLSLVAEQIEKNLSEIPSLVHLWRFLAGVVYALNKYHQATDSCTTNNYFDESAYIEDTKDVLSNILEKEHPNKSWLKGFYYNAAIMRLDACYERLFKAYLGKEQGDGPCLYKKIRETLSCLFPIEDYDKSTFGKVRKKVVNCLKHDVGGAEIENRENPELLHQALTELVEFISDETVTKKLDGQFPRGTIIVGKQTKRG